MGSWSVVWWTCGGCMEVDRRSKGAGRGKNHDPVTRGSHSPILARSISLFHFFHF